MESYCDRPDELQVPLNSQSMSAVLKASKYEGEASNGISDFRKYYQYILFFVVNTESKQR
jgi:hypothetical protein